VHCNMQAPGSQPGPWGTMTSGFCLSTFLREGPLSGPCNGTFTGNNTFKSCSISFRQGTGLTVKVVKSGSNQGSRKESMEDVIYPYLTSNNIYNSIYSLKLGCLTNRRPDLQTDIAEASKAI